MSDCGDNVKYKWTPESTTLLVSVWTDKQVQKQLEYAQRPQLIWESVARYMTKKGYAVNSKQCRSRMKQVLVCYREAKRAGTRSGVEQYYESIDKVLKSKKVERNDNGFDTVDSALTIKSPPKDVKTNRNLKMRYNKYGEPVESLIRTEALSPTWHLAHEEEYPDSPESNETVLAQPYRAFSPTRDAATNTLNGPTQLLAKSARRTLPLDEQPIRESRVSEPSLPNNRFGEMLYQNSVQNVHNQIIQENMQQQQRNFLQSQFAQDEAIFQPEQLYRRHSKRNPIFYPGDENVASKLRPGPQNRALITTNEPQPLENAMRMQNQLQQTCAMDNRAVPQEPRRENFGQNLAANYKLYKEAPEIGGFTFDQNLRTRQRTNRNYSPETAANLNEAFRGSPRDERNRHNFNDSYDQQLAENDAIRAMNATTITNNATFNDDTLSIEFLEGSPSPSPSDNGAVGSKSVSGNSDKVPDAPVRRKKAQKLEQLMLSAITSQSEVVNKILAAQDAMVSRFLDLDRDRQNRLENRLDHLLNVVHATVLNKSAEKDPDAVSASNPSEQQVITNLEPPPRPGAIPPKLDLVPPKPCRVPCTTANGNVELVNKNPVETRPGVVSPIKPPGAIWSKLGPVSQSPFVKAQQQLGLRFGGSNGEARTQSSAERRIARELSSRPMDPRAVMIECERFLDSERQTQEKEENARILAKMGHEVATRRKLFAGRGELNAEKILTAAFLDAERCASAAFAASTRNDFPRAGNTFPRAGNSFPHAGNSFRDADDEAEDEELMLLAGQVEKYERLRRLKAAQSLMANEPLDTSTPAKATKASAPLREESVEEGELPRQTIQQLAELVMKSARWRDAANGEKMNNRYGMVAPPAKTANVPQMNLVTEANGEDQATRACDMREKRRSCAGRIAERESNDRALGWLQDRYSYGAAEQISSGNRNIVANNRNAGLYEGPELPAVPLGPHAMGFSTENLGKIRQLNEQLERNACRSNAIGFNPEILLANNNNERQRNVAFAELEAPLAEKNGQATFPRQRRQAPEPPQQYQNRESENCRQRYATLQATQKNMIDRYVQDNCRGDNARRQQRNSRPESDDDDEYLDTTMSMQPSRKTSLTSNGTSSGKQGNCTIS